jgi:hypothetical protein
MTEPDNLVLQHLRAIREQLDTLNDGMLELMERIGNVGAQVANICVRADRLDKQLDRVERRLGLIEARILVRS